MPKNDLLNIYIALLSHSNLSENTRREYESRVRRFVGFISTKCENGKALDQADLDTYVQVELATLSRQTVRCYMVAIKHFLDTLGLGLSVPNVKVEQEKAAPILLPEELTKYLLATRRSCSIRDQAIVALICTTGARMREIRNARIRDIEFFKSRIRAYIPTGNYPDLTWAEEVLDAWLHEHSSRLDENARLFYGKSRQSLSRHALDLIVRKLGWKSRLFVSFEMLRNTHYASICFSPVLRPFQHNFKELSFYKGRSIKLAVATVPLQELTGFSAGPIAEIVSIQ